MSCDHQKYLNDKFCSDCGLELDITLNHLSLADLAPESIEKLKVDFPNLYVITGRLEQVYIYRRYYKSVHQVSSGDNKTTINTEEFYTFIWIKLVNEKGETYEGSVKAETNSNVNLKKGDVITLFVLKKLYMNYKLENRQDKKVVVNNDLASAIIIHDAEQNSLFLDDYFNPPAKKYTGFSFFIFFSILLPGLFYFDWSQGFAYGISALAAAVSAYFELKRTNSKYKLGVEKYERVKANLLEMLSVTRQQLGYDQLIRSLNDNDIICISCECRASQNDTFCNRCGRSLVQIEDSHITNHQHANSNDDIVLKTKLEAEVENTSIADMEDAIRKEYSMEYETDFVYTNLLSSTYRSKAVHKCYLAKIVNINKKASVSESKSVYGTETTYDLVDANDGSYRGSKTKTVSEVNKTRFSDVYAYMTIYDGESEREFTLKIDALNKCNVGDWLFFSSVTYVRDGKELEDSFGYYNISSDTSFESNDTDLDYFTDKDSTILTFLFIAALASSIYFSASDYQFILKYIYQLPYDMSFMNSDFMPLYIFGAFWLVVILGNFIFRLKDRLSFNNGRKRIKNLRKQIGKKDSELRERLKKLK